MDLILDPHRHQDTMAFCKGPFSFGGRGEDPESSAIDKGYGGSEGEGVDWRWIQGVAPAEFVIKLVMLLNKKLGKHPGF